MRVKGVKGMRRREQRGGERGVRGGEREKSEGGEKWGREGEKARTHCRLYTRGDCKGL